MQVQVLDAAARPLIYSDPARIKWRLKFKCHLSRESTMPSWCWWKWKRKYWKFVNGYLNICEWYWYTWSDEQHYKPWSQARSRWHASKSPALVNIDSQPWTCEVCERQDYSLICCSIMPPNKDLDLAFLLLDFFITIISVAHSTSSQKYLRISTPNYIQNNIYQKIAFPPSIATCLYVPICRTEKEDGAPPKWRPF